MKPELVSTIELANGYNATAQEISTVYPMPPREFRFNGNAGEINDYRDSEHKKIGIPTDSGIVLNKDQEALTTNVAGCGVFLLLGKKCNLFFHLTPNSRLGYRYFKSNNPQELVQLVFNRVMKHLPKDEVIADMQGIMVVNSGSNNGGNFDSVNILSDAEKFCDNFRRAGLAKIKVAEVPLNSTTAYFTPTEDKKVFVCGMKTSVNEEGYLQTSKNVRGFWVDINQEAVDNEVNYDMLAKVA